MRSNKKNIFSDTYTWVDEVSGKIGSFIVVLDEVWETWWEVITRSKKKLTVGNICTKSTEMEVVCEGMHVKQNLYIIYLIQKGIDGKL